MGYLLEQLALNGPVDPVSVAQREGGIQREPLQVGTRIEGLGSALAVFEQMLDAVGGLEVEDGHVRLRGWPVERRGSGLAPALAGFIPGGGADGEALGGGDDGVKGVEFGTGNERGLVGDPEMADCVERVDKDDAL